VKEYLDTLKHILVHGEVKKNRTGVDTTGVFGYMTRMNLGKGFPATTTKKLAWKSVVSELLWFLEGSGDERRLAELRFGKDRSELMNKKTIWTQNAEALYWKERGFQEHDGDLGRVYGVQWRRWRTATGAQINYDTDPPSAEIVWKETDQIKNIVEKIKHDPSDRRIILNAWNPGELDQMALPPCHLLAHFNVRSGKVDCLLYQRSCDTFLGVPFNIASYALLTHMIAHVTGLEAGDFIHTFGDLHIYENHLEQVDEQLTRVPMKLPKLWLNPSVTNIDDFTMDDIKLVGYESHAAIKGDMAV